MTGSLPSPRAEISDGSFEALEVESVRSTDAALVAAKANGFHNFDVEVAGNVSAEAALRLRGKLRARELVELRKLVEGEPRFSVLLDRHCKAVHELILCKNPAPVLAVLAGLVWSSLSIAWELDTSHMPKARMKMQLEELRVKLAKVLQDLSRSRSSYLKELVSHREKLRRFDELSLREIERLVHEEQPVMFYEPLNYLDDETKVHVSEVIEEKLKLLLKRLQVPAPLDLKHFLATEVPEAPPEEVKAARLSPRSDEEEEKEAALAQRERELNIKEVRLKAQLDEMRLARQTLEGEMSQKLQEAEARHSKSQMVAAEFKANFQQAQAELSSVAKAARKEWQELASIRGEQLPQAPGDGVSAQTLLMQLFRLEGQVRDKLLSGATAATAATEDRRSGGSSSEVVKDVAALEQQRQSLKVQVQDLRKEVAAAETQKLEATSARKQQAQELAELQKEVERTRRQLEEMKQTCQLEKQREPQELQKAVPQATQSQQPKVLSEETKELATQLELEKSREELQALRGTQLELEKTRAELQELRRAQVERTDFLRRQELQETEIHREAGDSQERGKAAIVIGQVQDARSVHINKENTEAATHPVQRQSAQNTAEKAIQVDTGAYFEVQETRSPSEPRSSKKPVVRKAPERCDKIDKTTQVELEKEAVAGREASQASAVQPAGLRGENQQLRFEVSRLQKVLLELQSQLQGLAARPETGGEVRVPDFPWKSTAFHLSKVHERLYLDAYERQERQRALQETIQRAREFEVLDVFRSQHPWLNPARNAQDAETAYAAWSISSLNWSSEGLEETTQVTQAPEPILDPLKPSVCSRRSSRLVPSPRSPEPGDSLEAEGVSPGEYLPLVVCSLEGDEARQRRPSSSTPTLLGRSATGKRRGGLPLSGEVLRPVRPMSAASGLQPRKVQEASGLQPRKVQEGLRLLASKPGEGKTPTKAMARPKSVGSLRCLL